MNFSLPFHSRPFLASLVCVALTAATSARAATALPPRPGSPVASFEAGMLHVDKYGSGERAVVLIPGLACGPWVWYGTIATLAPRFAVYVVSLPGFDGRPASDRKPLFDRFAQDFWAMLAAHHVTRPVVVGHSLGGTLAIFLAEEHPDSLAGIVSVDGLPVFPSLAYATAEQRAEVALQYSNMYASLDQTKAIAAEEHYMSTLGTIRPDLATEAAKLEAKSDMKAVAAWAQEDLAIDLRPQLARITIPVLEIMPYNPADARPPVSYSQEQTTDFYRSLLAGAPKATVVAITPARHFAMLDQPDDFAKELERFLISVARP